MRYSSPLIINTENEITTYVFNYTQCHEYSLSLTLNYLENSLTIEICFLLIKPIFFQFVWFFLLYVNQLVYFLTANH